MSTLLRLQEDFFFKKGGAEFEEHRPDVMIRVKKSRDAGRLDKMTDGQRRAAQARCLPGRAFKARRC